MSRGEIKNLNQLLRRGEIAFRYDLVNWQVDKELDELGVFWIWVLWRNPSQTYPSELNLGKIKKSTLSPLIKVW